MQPQLKGIAGRTSENFSFLINLLIFSQFILLLRGSVLIYSKEGIGLKARAGANIRDPVGDEPVKSIISNI